MAEIVEPVIILKRDNHLSFLAEKYQQFLDRGKYLDVTLVVEGEPINAHRLVLCASSQYFEEYFDEHPVIGPQEVTLSGVRAADIRALLKLMYTGEVSVTRDQFPFLFETALALKIHGLLNEALINQNSSTAHAKELGADQQQLDHDREPAVENCGFYPTIIPESVKSIAVMPTSVNQRKCREGEEVQIKPENISEDDMIFAQENDKQLNLVMRSPAAPNELPMKEELVNQQLTFNGDCDFQISGQENRTSYLEQLSTDTSYAGNFPIPIPFKRDYPCADYGDEQAEENTAELNEEEMKISDDERGDDVAAHTGPSVKPSTSQPKKKGSYLQKTAPKRPRGISQEGTPIAQRPFKCNQCGETYKRKDHLKRHLEETCRLTAPRLKLFCSECSKSFSRRAYLRIHQLNVHKLA